MDMADIIRRLDSTDRQVQENGRLIATHMAGCDVRNLSQTSLNTDFEERLRAVERIQWKSAGVIGLAALLGSAVVGPLVTFLISMTQR